MIASGEFAMISRSLSILATVLLMSAAPAHAQLNFHHRPAKDPYRNLFVTQQAGRDKPRAEIDFSSKNTPPQLQKPFLMCGTLVVPSDPSVDLKIRVGPREDGVWHTMRVVPPPACNDRQ
jgi:hypothetical protein